LEKDETKPEVSLASIEESETLSVAACGIYALPENFAKPEFKNTTSSYFSIGIANCSGQHKYRKPRKELYISPNLSFWRNMEPIGMNL